MQASTHKFSVLSLTGFVFLTSGFLGATLPAGAALINVTQSTWGTTAEVGSFAWAIDQANSQAGRDTINVSPGLEINVDAGVGTGADNYWLGRFTESADVQGNGAKLVGNPYYVKTDGGIATKTNILDGPYGPAIHEPPDIVQIAATSFAQIGTLGSDNSAIDVTITDLNADGLASVANVYEGARLTVTGGRFENLVNYTESNAVGRPAFYSLAGSTLNLSEISIERDYPFGDVIDATAEAAFFFGTIKGIDSELNLVNSSIRESFGAGAVDWFGGTANIVSSVIEDAGGLSISDSASKEGTLNFVNSILKISGFDKLSQTNRIQAFGGSEVNILASTVLFDGLYTDDNGCSTVTYQCNGMPLTALVDAKLNVTSSVVIPINAELSFPGKQSYSQFSTGDLIAGDYNYIAATPSQNAAAVKALFANTGIITDGDAIEILDLGGIVQEFLALPSGAFPVPNGALVNVVPNAGSGGINELINPIDGQPILVDVFGNPRTTTTGFRDIGAVQLVQSSVPEPQVFSAGLLALAFSLVLRGRRRLPVGASR